MTARCGWRCAWCAGASASASASPQVRASTPALPASPPLVGAPHAPVLLVALPASPSPQTPLVFVCEQCAREMIQCESCWALVPSVGQSTPGGDRNTDSDGVSACRRCGFLSVQSASLRALLQLPPWRDADGKLWRSVPLAESVRLRQLVSDLADKLKVLRTAASSEELQKAEAGAPDSEVAQLHRQWRDALLSVDLLAAERRRALSWKPAPTSGRSAVQCFSTTQLHFLRVMYDNSAERASLMDAVPAIERFLASQPALLQMKFDLLAAYRAHVLSDQLTKRSLDGKEFVGSSTADAVSVATSYWEAQLQHRWSEFQAQAHRHLPVVATVNRFLRPLYKAASDLERSIQRPSSDRSTAVAGMARPILANSPMSRKRRRFSGPQPAMRGALSHAVAGQDSNWHDAEVAGVQRQLEINSQVADAAKKAELWRALAFAVSSAAVVSIKELVDAAARA